MTLLQPLRQRDLARSLAAVACAALLLAQGLALWHAVAHGHVGAGASAVAHTAQVADRDAAGASRHVHARHGGASDSAEAAEPGGDAWVHAAGDAACHLVEHLLVGIAVAPPANHAGVTRCPQGQFPVASPAAARGIAAAFLARGPPRA